ncbi:MAG: hypothetical protein CL678_15850 [Bdellovibrionaceae bacterium]|nr:hypothetical protein [Pseudobdellovibrionaceae bacterium]
MKYNHKPMLVTLANATELTARVIADVVGGDLASEVGDEPVTSESMCGVITAKLQNNIANSNKQGGIQ